MAIKFFKKGFFFFLFLVLMFLVNACKGRAPKTSCLYGDKVPEAELEGIVKTGGKLMKFLVDKDYRSLYEAGSRFMKKAQTRDQFATVMKASDETFGEKDYPRLEEIFLIESEAKEDTVTVVCNRGIEGADNLHYVKSNEKIAVLSYNTKSDYGILRVVVQLVWEDEQWKLASVVQNRLTIRGHTNAYYWNLARENREKNLLHLAFLQYDVAMVLSDMGPNIDEPDSRAIAREALQIKVDYMPRGMAQIWETSEGNNYKVHNIGVLVSKEDIFVEISYSTSSLDDIAAIEKESGELTRFVRKKFPEYEKGFDGIVITAHSEKPDEMFQLYRVIERFK